MRRCRDRKETNVKGKCLCGAVAFEIAGKLPKIYQCHCSLCRRVSGSASNSAMLVTAADFHWLCGEDKIVKYRTASGFRSEFCGCCGSPLPNETNDGALFWVPAGLLDDPADTELAMHVHVGSKSRWDTAFLNDPTPQYPEMPPVSEFMALLHGTND